MGATSTAINQQIAWKNPEMRRFAVALVRAALGADNAEFTTDLVADQLRGDGTGIAGSAVTVLKDAHIIEPVGITSAGTWYAARRQSERPGAKSRYLNIYKLTSRPLALAFLAANNITPQPDLALS